MKKYPGGEQPPAELFGLARAQWWADKAVWHAREADRYATISRRWLAVCLICAVIALLFSIVSTITGN